MKLRAFDWSFLIAGWLVQVIVFWLAPAHPLSLVSGLLGITSVILCSQGNILTFFFGFGQIITYTYLCWLERFYAGIAMNAFYFVSQIYGIYAWRRLIRTAQQSPSELQSASADDSSSLIVPRNIPLPVFALIIVAMAAVAALAGWLLARYTDDSQPYIDALTTTVSVVAQIMLVMAIRQQWWLWLFVDVLFVVMWIIAGNGCMVAQYIFWCANCIYGLIRWQSLVRA